MWSHERATNAFAPDLGEFVRAHRDFSNASQPLAIKRNTDRKRRCFTSERQRLRRCECRAANRPSCATLVAHPEERSVAAMIVICQRRRVTVRLAAQKTERFSHQTPPSTSWLRARGDERTILTQDSSIGIRNAVVIRCRRSSPPEAPDSRDQGLRGGAPRRENTRREGVATRSRNGCEATPPRRGREQRWPVAQRELRRRERGRRRRADLLPAASARAGDRDEELRSRA